MYRIYIDATDRYKKSVELQKDGRVIDHTDGDVDLVSTVNQLIRKNGLKTVDIEEIYSNPGPGSFTGLKISSTISNIFNWATGKKKVNELTYPNYGREPNITPPKAK